MCTRKLSQAVLVFDDFGSLELAMCFIGIPHHETGWYWPGLSFGEGISQSFVKWPHHIISRVHAVWDVSVAYVDVNSELRQFVRFLLWKQDVCYLLKGRKKGSRRRERGSEDSFQKLLLSYHMGFWEANSDCQTQIEQVPCRWDICLVPHCSFYKEINLYNAFI